MLNTLNMNDSFRLETQPVSKVLIPKNLLQSSKHKEEINRAYMSQYPGLEGNGAFGNLKAVGMGLHSTLDHEEFSIDGGEDRRVMLFSKDASREEDQIKELSSQNESFLESPKSPISRKKLPLSPQVGRNGGPRTTVKSTQNGKGQKRGMQQAMIAGIRQAEEQLRSQQIMQSINSSFMKTRRDNNLAQPAFMRAATYDQAENLDNSLMSENSKLNDSHIFDDTQVLTHDVMFPTPHTKGNFGTSRASLHKGKLGQLMLQNRNSFQSRKPSIESHGKFYMSGNAQYHHTNINSKFIIPQVMLVDDSLGLQPSQQPPPMEDNFEPLLKQIVRDVTESSTRKTGLPVITHHYKTAEAPAVVEAPKSLPRKQPVISQQYEFQYTLDEVPN